MVCLRSAAVLLACAISANALELTWPPAKHPWAERIDRAHDAACRLVLNWTEGVDSWLVARFDSRNTTADCPNGEPPLVYRSTDAVEKEGSRIILSPVFDVRDYEGFSLGLKARARLKLPQLSRRLSLIFDSDYDDRDLTPDIAKSQDVGLRSGDRTAANLQYEFEDRWLFKTRLEAGLKFRPEPVPRIGVRGRLSRKVGPATSRFTQTFFWDGDYGWGERSSLDFEKRKRDLYYANLNANVLWAENSDGVQGGSTFQIYRFLNRSRAYGFIAGAYGPLEPRAYVDMYSVRLSWRQKLFRDWLFLEIAPGFDWPEKHDLKQVAIFQIKFDIVIGDWTERTNGY